MSTHKYSTIWVDTNPTHLLNELKFYNPNMACLLNRLVMSTHLSNFIKAKKKTKKQNKTNFSINLIYLNYKKPNIIIQK